jgi:hypothetical protein
MRLISYPDTAATAPAAASTDAVIELDATLAALQGGMKALVSVADDKLGAMRRADVEALHACATRETDLLEAHLARERERDAVLARLAQQMPALRAPRRAWTAVVEALPEPGASRIRARMQGLRAVAGELQKKNALAADVARKLQSHIREVFTAVAHADRECIGYGRHGRQEQTTARQWVDALG